MARISSAIVLLALVAVGSAKVWERCDLARTLLQTYKLPREQIGTCMCIAYRESRYNSTHINTINTDGSKDYGIFQINNRYWCNNKDSPQPNQNMCKVPCDTVLNNMAETVKCIKFMYAKSKNTWQPWTTYPYCKKQNVQTYLKGCKI